MPHKDDSRFSILTVTMIIIIYIGNKSNFEKKVSDDYDAITNGFSSVLCGTSDHCYENLSLSWNMLIKTPHAAYSVVTFLHKGI